MDLDRGLRSHYGHSVLRYRRAYHLML
jgi:hypothetical protein